MDHLTDLPGHLIRRLNQLAVSAFTAEAKAAGFDLTPVQYGSLATIFAEPGIDQATLAARVAYDPVTIGGVVARLEARGYLDRHVSPEDRRAKLLTLTQRGASVVQTIQPAVRAAQQQIIAPLSRPERAEFLRILHKLTATEKTAETERAATEA
ncbi:MarR family transcriptional regulator [Paracoccus aurantiacus]|uniref:MarR family transcriptional regulator n=1 Tax=Paracoccus aurantiacus TaxID=2599412 RepID=A0A5C6RVS1_9RHOB|nr:MarR family transcriptional regulator [Paracoccus aurantiacus]TXB66461.1 MarR family transcriptional regulator [Paracoccus aurantiacus]